MSDQSGSARIQLLFEAYLKEYEKQTDITLEKNPLTEKFQQCDSVESVVAIFQEQVLAGSEFKFRGGDRTMKSFDSAISVLCMLSVVANLGLVRPNIPMGRSMSLMLILKLPPFSKAIYVGLAILIGVCPPFLFLRAYLRHKSVSGCQGRWCT